jgi:hypothetical protein
MADRIRIEIGFDGGQIVALETTEENAAQVTRAFAASSSTRVSIEGDGCSLHVDTGRIAYVRRGLSGRQIGYSPP